MLKIQNISKTFNPNTVNEKKALQNLSLQLEKGDFLTIIGSNGSGKSTLFNSIGGSFLTDCGKIFLDNEDITFMPEYKRAKSIGRLFQDPMRGTAPSMTIEENLSLAYMRSNGRRSPFGLTSKDKEFFREKLAELDLGLENRMKSKVGLLSGGQRQALTLMMATLVTPKLLLLDEHTAALDPATAEKIIDVTEKIVSENNITCMMITHNITSALQMGNKLIMMDNGKIILQLEGESKKNKTVLDIMELFKAHSNKEFDNDEAILIK